MPDRPDVKVQAVVDAIVAHTYSGFMENLLLTGRAELPGGGYATLSRTPYREGSILDVLAGKRVSP